MPRKKPEKLTHTCPEKAGPQNMVGLDLPKDESGIMEQLMPMMQKGKYYRTAYAGKWTEEALADSLEDYFEYCREVKFKPTLPSLAVWLGVSKSQLFEWKNNHAKYGYKSVQIAEALGLMEAYLQANIDKYPTGSTFLLKTTHGHVEQSKLDITTNGRDIRPDADEINERIARLKF